ncbi:hypothetical protein AAFF_G00206550 [Aldrovandia affinis]|uniref:Heparan-sulfate 6-O-sulfotransferase n=1 Tax=Aldrovandia affinis TaxID=143900 RepID=A0AAD7W5M8_9TELE|nr:hypothetical protein AAFF_G00206550 [Aldrovandia affinis]
MLKPAEGNGSQDARLTRRAPASVPTARAPIVGREGLARRSDGSRPEIDAFGSELVPQSLVRHRDGEARHAFPPSPDTRTLPSLRHPGPVTDKNQGQTLSIMSSDHFPTARVRANEDTRVVAAVSRREVMAGSHVVWAAGHLQEGGWRCVSASAPKLSSAGKFYYITLLRDPVSRYLSEWRHVQRGATWKTSLHMCDGRTPTPEELPACYEGTDWSGCTLQQFMDCPYNLANNRQVRMLADLSLVGCYNMSFVPEKKRAQTLLESAKKNLRDMAFFGLTEFQRKTQYLFERTFHLRFIRPFMQYNSTRAAGVDVDNDTILRIEELNELDMQLYDYAKDLFQQRYQYKRQLDRREQRLRSQAQFPLLRTRSDPGRDEGGEEVARLPTEDYMNHIINRW